MHPELVGGQVGGVEISLRQIKDHAMDASVGLVGIVLGIGLQGAGCADREDVAEAGMLVEGVAIHGVRWLLGGEEEDGTGVGRG